MAGYIIAEVEVTDPETYATYRAQTPGVVARYGGRFLVRGGAAELLEGDDPPARLVVIAFSDVAAARRFYELARISGDHRHPAAGGQQPGHPGRGRLTPPDRAPAGRLSLGRNNRRRPGSRCR